MSDTPIARTTLLALHGIAGLVVSAAMLSVGYIVNRPIGPGFWRAALVAWSATLFALTRLSPASRAARMAMTVYLAMVAVVVSTAVAEATFRVVGIDWSGHVQAQQQTPPFFRQPTEASGEVYFRRPGPERWTGQVLFTFLRQSGVMPNPYASEPEITVAYDKNGFRNAGAISRWTIAVAGDSFTELGHLPDESLFTTVMSRELRTGVLNLGTSYTGPLTQLSYLRDYGVGPSTKHALIVFFEGNDLDDLDRETEDLRAWQRSGERGYREVAPDPSVTRALFRWTTEGWNRAGRDPRRYVAGHFQSADGPVPISLVYAPPGSAALSDQTRAAMHSFVREYARFAKQHHLTSWLAYMPSKERSVHGLVSFEPVAHPSVKQWTPTDLPSYIGGLSTAAGIRFIDLSPTLAEHTRKHRRLLYNSIHDTHLNREGSRLVAEELARHFRKVTPTF